MVQLKELFDLPIILIAVSKLETSRIMSNQQQCIHQLPNPARKKGFLVFGMSSKCKCRKLEFVTLFKTFHHSSYGLIMNWTTTKSILTHCLIVWYWNCTIPACKTLQQILKTADKNIRVFLPSTSYCKRCIVLAEGTRHLCDHHQAPKQLPRGSQTAQHTTASKHPTGLIKPFPTPMTVQTAHLHFLKMLLWDTFILATTHFSRVNSLQTALVSKIQPCSETVLHMYYTLLHSSHTLIVYYCLTMYVVFIYTCFYSNNPNLS